MQVPIVVDDVAHIVRKCHMSYGLNLGGGGPVMLGIIKGYRRTYFWDILQFQSRAHMSAGVGPDSTSESELLDFQRECEIQVPACLSKRLDLGWGAWGLGCRVQGLGCRNSRNYASYCLNT